MRLPSSTTHIPIYGLPLQWWIVLPGMILCLYAVFRWRGLGKDSYTWDHRYGKYAASIGLATTVGAAYSSIYLPPIWEAVGWLSAFTFIALMLRFNQQQDWANVGILSTAIVLLGVGSIPVAGQLGHLLFRPVTWNRGDSLAGIARSTFSPELPPGWKELPGAGHRYSRQEAGSGILQISLEPPSDLPHPTGVDAEKDLTEALDSIAKGLDLGQRVSLAHDDAASGPMAFADYRTDAHGPLRFWMILSETRIFASYTDGKSPAAEREIGEAQQILKTASTVHH